VAYRRFMIKLYPTILTEIPVGMKQIQKAKRMQDEFNMIKVSNKFPNRKTDFHGALGELMFDLWLKIENVDYEWVEFITNIPNDPDFTFFNGSKTLDVKTTRFGRLYFQKIEWDYYVLVEPCDFQGGDYTKPQAVKIKGWLSKEEMMEIKNQVDSGNISNGNKETKFGKESYFVYADKLNHIGELLEIIKQND